MIVSSRALNHPFGRNQDRVWVGDGGIMKYVAKPMMKVKMPSTRKSHHHQHAVDDETRNDAADVGRHPEEREADGELGFRVEV